VAFFRGPLPQTQYQFASRRIDADRHYQVLAFEDGAIDHQYGNRQAG
jgi:hypothetical protein